MFDWLKNIFKKDEALEQLSASNEEIQMLKAELEMLKKK